jgi:hypothetical protein
MHQYMDSDPFWDQNVYDEVMCRCLSLETFGAPLANEENDVPLYDMYNRGLVACQDDRPRTNLAIEGGRPGTTGLIPSMEEALSQYPSSSPKPKALVLELETVPEKEKQLSLRRKGLMR